jgi:hypothetical protein
MGGAPQVAMRVTSQIWQIVFASQTLQVFRLALRKKAQYVVMKVGLRENGWWVDRKYFFIVFLSHVG